MEVAHEEELRLSETQNKDTFWQLVFPRCQFKPYSLKLLPFNICCFCGKWIDLCEKVLAFFAGHCSAGMLVSG